MSASSASFSPPAVHQLKISTSFFVSGGESSPEPQPLKVRTLAPTRDATKRAPGVRASTFTFDPFRCEGGRVSGERSFSNGGSLADLSRASIHCAHGACARGYVRLQPKTLNHWARLHLREDRRGPGGPPGKEAL